MTKINRRKFISIFGVIGFGGLVTHRTQGLDISVNRFGYDKNINLQNTHSIAIRIKEITINSNNIDYSKDAKLTLSVEIEDSDVGQVMSKNINLQKSGTTIDSETIHINEPELFSYDKYDKEYLDTYMTFKLDHPSIKKSVKEEVIYKIGISPSGKLTKHSFDKHNKFDITENKKLDNLKVISGSNLSLLTIDNRFKKLKRLIGGGGLIEDNTGSEYTIPSGFIDMNQVRFQYSSPRNYRNISNKKESMVETIDGSDLSVLTVNNKLEKLKKLIGGGGLIEDNTGSEYTIPSGFIDMDQLQFQYSSPRDYQGINNNEPDKNKYYLK